MTRAMYTHSVPVFKQMLTALKAILAQADAQAAAKSIEPDAYLQARLFPDMFPLVKQVQIAADFARGVSARLAGVEVPSYEGKERSFADLDGLLTRTLAFLDGVPASGFEGSEAKDIVLRPGTPKEKKMTGEAYSRTTACRSSSFMSPPRMPFCGTTDWRSGSGIIWEALKRTLSVAGAEFGPRAAPGVDERPATEHHLCP